MSEKKVKKSDAIKNSINYDGFCVYLGPTITGVIQSGTIYRGTKAKVLTELGAVIDKYPLIKTLVVSDKTLSEDRIKVKTPGNILYVNYQKMLPGKN